MNIKDLKYIPLEILIPSGVIFIVSEFQSMFLFIQFSTNPVIIGFFLAVSIVCGMARVGSAVGFVVFLIKTFSEKIPTKKKGESRRKWECLVPAAGFIILYFGLLLFQTGASIGFTSSNIAKQEKAYNDYSAQIKSDDLEYSSLQREYTLALDEKERLIKSTNSKQWQIADATENIRIAKTALKNYKKPAEKKIESSTETTAKIFDDIHETILSISNAKVNISPDRIKGFMLLLLSGIIEILLQGSNVYMFVSLWIKKRKETTRAIEKTISESKPVENEPTISSNEKIDYRKVIRDDFEKIVVFVDALLDIPFGLKRLNGNDKIMNKTKLKEKECEIYKKILNSVVRRKAEDNTAKFLINTVAGSSDANFSKDKIIEALQYVKEGKI
jgi:hypothetical protein